MNKKQIPPPPTFPPKVNIPDDFCLFHKGKLTNSFYTCPKCNTKYCLECAQKAHRDGVACVKCKQLILI